MVKKADWEAWNKERQRYQELETLGWEQDISSLEQHIQTLIEVAPRDKANWINLNALDAITKLKNQLIQAKTWAGLMP